MLLYLHNAALGALAKGRLILPVPPHVIGHKPTHPGPPAFTVGMPEGASPDVGTAAGAGVDGGLT